MNLTSPTEIRKIMTANGLRFNKSLGQNFLTDDSVLDTIVNGSDITQGTTVIEIGPGIGCLTQALSKSAKNVIAIELDRGLVDFLNKIFADTKNIEIISGDVLKIDLKEILSEQSSADIRVAANLPYYITSPIIMKLLEENLPIKTITVMVQKEVAKRMTSQPGSKDYGALSVAVQYYTDPEILCIVPANSFMPPPKVDSAVVKLTLNKKELGVDENQFFKIVKASFAQRRKTLVNALENSGKYKMIKPEIIETITSMGLNDKIRGETLSLEQFAQLAKIIT